MVQKTLVNDSENQRGKEQYFQNSKGKWFWSENSIPAKLSGVRRLGIFRHAISQIILPCTFLQEGLRGGLLPMRASPCQGFRKHKSNRTDSWRGSQVGNEGRPQDGWAAGPEQPGQLEEIRAWKKHLAGRWNWQHQCIGTLWEEIYTNREWAWQLEGFWV